jgi:hypothetical protein
MKTIFNKNSQRFIATVLALLLFVTISATPPIKAHALQAVAVVTAATVFITTAVIIACQLNAFGICPPPGGSGSGGGGGGSGATVTPATNTTGTSGTSGTSGTGGTGGSVIGGICYSSANSVCGIKSQGTIVNGLCNATTPPNSACPAPIINASSGFYADPALVRSGNASTLHWSVSNATACAVTGGGLNLSNLGLSGSNATGAITSKTVYTLTCINGTGGPVSTVNTAVNLVPNTTEQ